MTLRQDRRTSAALRMQHTGAFALGLALIWLAVAPPAVAAETPWSRIQHASLNKPAAIGGPSNGCIDGAKSLAAVGRGFVSIRRHRNRYYGHPQTIRLVEDLGRAMDARNGHTIMIGDLAQPRGGRMNSSHVSHQNGLDVDVWLTLLDDPTAATRAAPEGQDPASMLTPNTLRLNQRFGPDQLFLIKTAAEDPAVDRILVNPGIKRGLCERTGNAPWLRKLRPWWGHDAHMHVRLKCPPGSPHCRQQAPVPAGSGCNATLAWWFSPEARKPGGSSSGKSSAKPRPPAQCQVLLRES